MRNVMRKFQNVFFATLAFLLPLFTLAHGISAADKKSYA